MVVVHVLDNAAPIDGSPSELRSHSGYYNSVTNSVRVTMDALQQVTSGLQTQSDAVEAFAEIANEVKADLELVEIRYETFVEQLGIYATELQRLQDEASGIRSAAQSAEDDRVSYGWRINQVNEELRQLDPQDPAWSEKAQLVQSLRAQEEDAEAVIWRKQRDLENLMDEWRTIADGCADEIAAALEASELNDGWWETFTHWVEHTLPSIEMWLDILAVVLTVLAILAVLTGVGAVLAPALFAIARGIQLLSKIIKIVKIVTTVVQVGRGEKPVSALLELAVDAAIDKVGGKLLDGLADKAMGGLIDKFGVALVDYAKKHGNDVLELNAKELVNNGFDEWVSGTFTDAVLPGVQMMPDGVTPVDLLGQADYVASGLTGGLADHFGDMILGPGTSDMVDVAMAPLDLIAGPETLLSGLGGDVLNLFDSPFHDRGLAQFPTPSFESVLPAMNAEPAKPSYEDLVSAS